MGSNYMFLTVCDSNRSEKAHVKLPLDIEDAKQLGMVLGRYKDMYYMEVMFAVILVYIL